MLRRSLPALAFVSSFLLGASLHAKPAKGTSTKHEKYKADAKAFADIEAAIYHHAGKTGGVIPFMKSMADHGYVKTDKGKITLAQFKEVWKDKDDAKWVEGKFRSADLGKHEWIPSNYIPKIIDRARTTPEGDKWIALQDKMRSPTNLILFKPSKWDVTGQGGRQKYIPQGHSGAAFDKRTGYELTEHQGQFHDELRRVFDQSSTIHATVEAIKDVVAQWVWKGEPLKYSIAGNVINHERKPFGPNASVQKIQRANYNRIMNMLNSIEETVSASTAKQPAG
jgi:hypothetical protein